MSNGGFCVGSEGTTEVRSVDKRILERTKWIVNDIIVIGFNVSQVIHGMYPIFTNIYYVYILFIMYCLYIILLYIIHKWTRSVVYSSDPVSLKLIERGFNVLIVHCLHS